MVALEGTPLLLRSLHKTNHSLFEMLLIMRSIEDRNRKRSELFHLKVEIFYQFNK